MKHPLTTSLAILLLAMGSSSAALVIFSNEDIPIPTNFDGVSVDLDGYINDNVDPLLRTGVSTSSDGVPGGDANFFFGGEGFSNDADATAGTPTLQIVRVADSGTANAAMRNVTAGSTVGPTTDYFHTGYGESGGTFDHMGTEFADGERGYLGFSLNLGGPTVYGYLDVTLTVNGAGVIHGWVYDDSGAPVPVPIPEPSAGLLSVLALGLIVLRRRRRV